MNIVLGLGRGCGSECPEASASLVFCFVLFFSVREVCASIAGNEAGGVGGPEARWTVLQRLAGDGELAQVVADHVRLDFHQGEGLAIVEAHHAPHHLGPDNQVPQVCLHHLGLLHEAPPSCSCAGASAGRAASSTGPLQPPLPGAGAVQRATCNGHQLLVGRAHAAVDELVEGPLLLLPRFHHPAGSADSSALLVLR